MSTAKYTPRLAKKYKDEVVPLLVKKFGYSSVMQTPKLKKIAINRGVNGAVTDKKLVDIAHQFLCIWSEQSQNNRADKSNGGGNAKKTN